MAYTRGDYDRKHLQLSWGGNLPGAEGWSCSLHLANDGSDIALADTFLEAVDVNSWVSGFIKDAIAAFHGRATTGINTYADLRWAKLALVQADGHYPPTGVPGVYTWSSPVAGGGGSSYGTYPNQVALAVTMLAAITRGPAHIGRFYLPIPAFGIGTDGRITAAQADGVAASAKTFLEALSDVPAVDVGGSPEVSLMSRKAGAAATHNVASIKVGRVPDTIRSRRRSLGESYSTTTVDFGTF